MIYIQCQRSVPVQEGVCSLCWEAESRTFMQKTRVCVTSLQLMFVFLLTVTTITTSDLIQVVRCWQELPEIGGAWSSVICWSRVELHVKAPFELSLSLWLNPMFTGTPCYKAIRLNSDVAKANPCLKNFKMFLQSSVIKQKPNAKPVYLLLSVKVRQPVLCNQIKICFFFEQLHWLTSGFPSRNKHNWQHRMQFYTFRFFRIFL